MEDTSCVIKLWVDEYSSDMLSWALYKTAHKQTAEDLVQDTITQFTTEVQIELPAGSRDSIISFFKNCLSKRIILGFKKP